MRFDAVAMGVCVALVFGGCHRTIEPPKSLVGATKLPSAANLLKETIFIARMGGVNAEDQLTVEIRPTNQVVATHYRGEDRRQLAQENLHASAQQVKSVRALLWRLRPDDGAPASKTVPVGCHYVDDAGYDWSVSYVREDRPANFVEFTLPYSEYCKTPAFNEARRLIWQVIGALPRSNVVQQFPPGRYHPVGTYSP